MFPLSDNGAAEKLGYKGTPLMRMKGDGRLNSSKKAELDDSRIIFHSYCYLSGLLYRFFNKVRKGRVGRYQNSIQAVYTLLLSP